MNNTNELVNSQMAFTRDAAKLYLQDNKWAQPLSFSLAKAYGVETWCMSGAHLTAAVFVDGQIVRSKKFNGELNVQAVYSGEAVKSVHNIIATHEEQDFDKTIEAVKALVELMPECIREELLEKVSGPDDVYDFLDMLDSNLIKLAKEIVFA